MFGFFVFIPCVMKEDFSQEVKKKKIRDLSDSEKEIEKRLRKTFGGEVGATRVYITDKIKLIEFISTLLNETKTDHI